ncbi:MAG: hypothetical protein HRU13_13935 [Phycisphaerales bacterium]|nr:hypothetical protein [Phycisphaerales bacterium]
MSKKKLFEDLKIHVITQVPKVKTFNRWNSQIFNEENEDPFEFPAVFFEYLELNWNDRGDSIQDAEGVLRIHIAYEQYIVDELDVFDLISEVFVAINGFSAEYLNELRRINEFENTDHDNVSEWLMDFSFRLFDCDDERTSKLVRIDPNLFRITVHSEPQKAFFVPSFDLPRFNEIVAYYNPSISNESRSDSGVTYISKLPNLLNPGVNDFVQTDESLQPTLQTHPDFKVSVNFDGVSQFMLADSILEFSSIGFLIEAEIATGTQNKAFQLSLSNVSGADIACLNYNWNTVRTSLWLPPIKSATYVGIPSGFNFISAAATDTKNAIYENAVLQVNQNITLGTPSTADKMSIGCRTLGDGTVPDQFFKGKIKAIVIYKQGSVLSQSDMISLFNAIN